MRNDAGRLALLERHRYAESPRRVEYELTTTGRDLLTPLFALGAWADRHGDTVHAAMTGIRTMSEPGRPGPRPPRSRTVEVDITVAPEGGPAHPGPAHGTTVHVGLAWSPDAWRHNEMCGRHRRRCLDARRPVRPARPSNTA
ncbi:winged helix-turn-helix transcriptional regulator [Nocardia thraciensis]